MQGAIFLEGSIFHSDPIPNSVISHLLKKPDHQGREPQITEIIILLRLCFILNNIQIFSLKSTDNFRTFLIEEEKNSQYFFLKFSYSLGEI